MIGTIDKMLNHQIVSIIKSLNISEDNYESKK